MGYDDKEMHTFEYDSFVRETDRAWCVRIGDDDLWFPKSVCVLDHQVREIDVPEWLAIERELV